MSSPLVSAGLRGCVERILSGDVRAQDLHSVFFGLRQESGGKGIVREVAHFVAHPEPRTQGLSHAELRDAFTAFRFRMQLETSKVITSDIPGSLPDSLRANMRRVRPSALKRETGMNVVQAGRILEQILDRLIPTGYGTFKKLSIRTKQELAVLMFVANRLKSGPLFTDDDLLRDLSHILQKQNLLRQSEVAALSQRKAAITIFALTTIQNKQVEVDGGRLAKLSIAQDAAGNLAIFAFAEVMGALVAIQPTTVGFWLFQTSLPVAHYCEPGVAPTQRHPFVGDFELTPTGKLGRIS